jgi:hypothetical protein
MDLLNYKQEILRGFVLLAFLILWFFFGSVSVKAEKAVWTVLARHPILVVQVSVPIGYLVMMRVSVPIHAHLRVFVVVIHAPFYAGVL